MSQMKRGQCQQKKEIRKNIKITTEPVSDTL